MTQFCFIFCEKKVVNVVNVVKSVKRLKRSRKQVTGLKWTNGLHGCQQVEWQILLYVFCSERAIHLHVCVFDQVVSKASVRNGQQK